MDGMERRSSEFRRSSISSQPYTKVVGFKVEGAAASPTVASSLVADDAVAGSPSPVIIPSTTNAVGRPGVVCPGALCTHLLYPGTADTPNIRGIRCPGAQLSSFWPDRTRALQLCTVRACRRCVSRPNHQPRQGGCGGSSVQHRMAAKQQRNTANACIGVRADVAARQERTTATGTAGGATAFSTINWQQRASGKQSGIHTPTGGQPQGAGSGTTDKTCAGWCMCVCVLLSLGPPQPKGR